MCDFKVLVYDEYGYVTQCCECNHIEIAFGTSLIRFPVQRLNAFINYLDEVKRVNSVIDDGPKNIILDLASVYSFQMILSYRELLRFCDTMEKVENELKTNALLDLFTCQDR